MSKVVFKQWIYAPNRNSTPLALGRMLDYIATRDGVSLEALDSSGLSLNNELEMMMNSSDDLYLDYIATRHGAVHGQQLQHGLFGKLLGMSEMHDIPDLDDARNHLSEVSKEKKTVYNAVISLRGDDAVKKGFTDRSRWSEYVDSKMYDIAREMDIPPRTLEWVGSFHMEKEHPHVHIMYWDTEQKVGVNFINPEKSNTIRKSMVKELFSDELKQIYQEKDLILNNILSAAASDENGVLSMMMTALSKMSDSELSKADFDDTSNKKILGLRNIDDKVYSLANRIFELDKLIAADYSKGSLKYKYLPQNLKDGLDEISKSIINDNPDILKEFNNFMSKVKEQGKMYGGKRNINYFLDKERRRLYTDIGNKILNCVPAIRKLADYENSLDIRSEPNQYSIATDTHNYDDKEINVPDNDDIIFLNEQNFNNDRKEACDTGINLERLVEAADKGNSFAQYKVGKAFLGGEIVEKDTRLAVDYLFLSANQDNEYAQYALGKLLLKDNEDFEKDIERGIELLDKSAEQGNQYAQFTLGSILLRGVKADENNSHPVACDVSKAIELLNKSAEQGNQYAQFKLGSILLHGVKADENNSHPVACDVSKAIELLDKSAEQGNQYAQFKLGSILLRGVKADESNSHPVACDVSKAIELLDKSAEQGNLYAQFTLGSILLRGVKADENNSHPVACDVSKAIELLDKSAEQGNQYAQYLLGKNLLRGIDFIKNKELGLYWLSKSAQQGNQYAQFTLGKLLLGNDIFKKNIQKAYNYLSKSAEQGNQYAQYLLGKNLLRGIDFIKNKELGLYWLSKSAQQGNQYAQYFIEHPYPPYHNQVIRLIRDVLNIAADYNRLSYSDKNRGHDLSKAEKKELKYKRQEKSIEWGD